MNAREAKKLACWIAAGVLDDYVKNGCLDNAVRPDDTEAEALTKEDNLRVFAQMRSLIDELERRSH